MAQLGGLLNNLLDMGYGSSNQTTTQNSNVPVGYTVNPDYNPNNPYNIPEGMRLENGRLISSDAPRGLGRLWAGLRDRWTDDRGLSSLFYSGTPSDHDMRGTPDRWGDYATAGSGELGSTPVKQTPYIVDPDNIGNANLNSGSPVPNMPLNQYYKNVLIQDAYTSFRDRHNMNRALADAAGYMKDANYYGYELDKAQLADYIASPLGASRLRTEAAQQAAIPRLAKAAVIEARAKSQEAANEFGQAGLKRTYFTV